MSVWSILKVKGPRVVTVTTRTSVEELVSVLARERIGAVVVCDDGAIVSGMVSERDIIQGLSRHGAALLDMEASSIMTTAVTTVRADAPLLQVLETMTEGRFRHAPVVENDRLVGLVSIGDAVKARLEILESETTQLRDYIGGH
jgi:CBS domain-containing protein